MIAARERKRGVAGFGVFTLAMLMLFIGLGVWQLQRRVEKHALIAALDERLAAAPVSLPTPAQWDALTPAKDEFRRVSFSATYQPLPDAMVYSSGSAVREDISGPGTWAFVPARLTGASSSEVDTGSREEDASNQKNGAPFRFNRNGEGSSGETVVINAGFVQNTMQDRAQQDRAVKPLMTGTPVTLTGYLRFPEQAGLLTPQENLTKRLWFTRDHLAMARALGWGGDGHPVAPFYIDLETPMPANGVPKPGPLEVHLKDDHMQYAITWFALAGAVVIAFGVWWRTQRRGA